jgi:F0F1-type ATP synthase membrane subunit b/b'
METEFTRYAELKQIIKDLDAELKQLEGAIAEKLRLTDEKKIKTDLGTFQIRHKITKNWTYTNLVQDLKDAIEEIAQPYKDKIKQLTAPHQEKLEARIKEEEENLLAKSETICKEILVFTPKKQK